MVVASYNFSLYQWLAVYSNWALDYIPVIDLFKKYALGADISKGESFYEFNPRKERSGIQDSNVREYILNKYEEFDKEFKFGVSGKMVRFMLPAEYLNSGIQETDSLLLDDFINFLKQGEKSDKEVKEIVENFDRNKNILEEWETETLRNERENRLFWKLEGRKSEGEKDSDILKKINQLENKRKSYNFHLPLGGSNERNAVKSSKYESLLFDAKTIVKNEKELQEAIRSYWQIHPKNKVYEYQFSQWT